jgi:hypothetical protein
MAKNQSIIRTLIQALPAILTIYKLVSEFVKARKASSTIKTPTRKK